MRSHLRRGTAIAAALAIGVFAAACGSDDSGDDAASSAAGAVSAAASSAAGAASSVEAAASSAVEAASSEVAEAASSAEAGASSAAASATPGNFATPADMSLPEGDKIVIGSTLPMSGPLGTFGSDIETGIKSAVDDVNAAGGLVADGQRHQIEWKMLDNKSDPNLASEQARTLLLQDGAAALVGSITPPLSIPISKVAEQVGRPFFTTTTPVQAWLSAGPYKWSFVWFFDEPQMTQVQMLASDAVETNKKVALFTDTEEDGVVMGGLWEQTAPTLGYEIAYRAEFPVGTTNFKDYVQKAKDSGAEVLIAQMIPPDAIALWKEMKSQGWQPKTAFCEKCSNSSGWIDALGDLGYGTSAAGWWDPSLGTVDAQAYADRWKEQVGGVNTDLANIVFHYSGAMAVFDAINTAGSTDPEAVRAALAATDKDYPAGRIKFNPDNSGTVPAIAVQWTEGKEQPMVYPPDQASVQIEAPVKGLAP